MQQRRLAPLVASQRGVTLVELMVGIAIGLIVVAAMSVLFANTSRMRVETERAGVKIDNGRYALDTLGQDLQHAGFLAEFDPRRLPLPATRPNACESAIAPLRAALALPVLGHDGVTTALLNTPALNCLADVVQGTDVLVVRRAATCANGSMDCTALLAGAPAFQASSCSDSLELGASDVQSHQRLAAFPAASDFTLRQRDCATPAPVRRYLVRIYYVSAHDKPQDGIPSLKRIELGAAGWGSPVTLVQGVENLQIEWGLDTDGDGTPDRYATDPDRYCATATPAITGGACWSLPVAAKLFVLARNIEAVPAYADGKRYTLGHAGDAATGLSTAADHTVGPLNDGFRRSVYQRAVALQNVSARRFSP